MDVLIPAWTGL